ncbi:hypothetical protein J6590_041913 [Homalodisca vitripennis]|nr:hypothetical protein J6590_041913 [Homalodisca vitripennis]
MIIFAMRVAFLEEKSGKSVFSMKVALKESTRAAPPFFQDIAPPLPPAALKVVLHESLGKFNMAAATYAVNINDSLMVPISICYVRALHIHFTEVVLALPQVL